MNFVVTSHLSKCEISKCYGIVFNSKKITQPLYNARETIGNNKKKYSICGSNNNILSSKAEEIMRILTAGV